METRDVPEKKVKNVTVMMAGEVSTATVRGNVLFGLSLLIEHQIVCQTNQACQGFPIFGLPDSDQDDADAQNMTCYTGGETVFQNHQMCDVTSALISLSISLSRIQHCAQIAKFSTQLEITAQSKLHLVATTQTRPVRSNSGWTKSNHFTAGWTNVPPAAHLVTTSTRHPINVTSSSASVYQDGLFAAKMALWILATFLQKRSRVQLLSPAPLPTPSLVFLIANFLKPP